MDRVCASCGATNPESSRFCGGCGVRLAVEPELRKTVTLLFCDVTGSTALGERLDPEALRHVLARYFDAVRTVIERHGGVVEKFAGDAVLAVFGIPRVHEDDALRAVRAAAEIRELLPALVDEVGVALELRTGVNTGRVVTGAGETLATGDAVNVAARLEQAAAPGEILIGPETRRLVRGAVEVEPAGPLRLKGKTEPVDAYRLLRVDPAAPAVARRRDAPFVGRDRELRLLAGAFERAVEERRCHLLTLLGAAGVGKTRLADEFLAGIDGRVLRGRCLHYGEGITFYPLVEALVPLGEPARPVLDLLAEGGMVAASELFHAVRRVLERVAADRPLVLVLDDLQWAEPMLLDLVDSVADLSRGAPILLLCLGRSELLEERAGWGGGKLNAATLLLEPLAAGECELLLEGLDCRLAAPDRARIVAASEGNPLFVEEMVALAREGGEVQVPPTIEALIAARLERLGGGERAVIERAAVEGNVFHGGAVRELAPEPVRRGLDDHLAALVRKELIRPETGAPPPADAYRFRHLLIRDAAYEELPKQTRAELHERFAGWIERCAPDLVELDEIAGWHLEQAVRYRRELGLRVEPPLVSRAAERLAAAGRRAEARLDVRAAINLLERALALLPVADARRPPLQVVLAACLITTARYDRADELLAEAEAADPGDPGAAVERFYWLLQTRPDEAQAFAAGVLPAAVERARAAGDERALAKVLSAQAMASWHASRCGAAGRLWKEALVHARAAGARDLIVHVEASTLTSFVHGPATADEMRAVVADLDRPDAPPFLEAWLLSLRSLAARMDGRFDEARELARRGRDEVLGPLGLDVWRAAHVQELGQIELAAGDPAAAVRILREGYDELGRLGEHAFRSTCGAMLATALAAAGEHADAERVAEAVEAESAPVDLINFALCRAVRAVAAEVRGELEAADRLADEALAYADETDFVYVRAGVREALAKVLEACGGPGEAAERLAEAAELYTRKGDRVLAGRARAARAALHVAG